MTREVCQRLEWTEGLTRRDDRKRNITDITRARGRISPNSSLPFLKTRLKDGRITNGRNMQTPPPVGNKPA
jgi:hypothetical protein